MAIFTCQNCGEAFNGKPHRAPQHCSRKCRREAGLKNRRKVCPQCGQEFLIDNTARDSTYCSRACSSLAHQNRPGRPCKQCGTVFYVKACSKRRYCSRSCFFDATRGQEKPSMKGRPAWNKGLTAETSKSIAEAAANFSGKNHPNWKGGKFKYYGPNWGRQSRAARKRDGHKCRHCGMTEKKLGRKLDVHHIIPFRTFGYIQDKNTNHKDANLLTNLITLCPDCHKKAEWGQIPIQPTLLAE